MDDFYITNIIIKTKWEAQQFLGQNEIVAWLITLIVKMGSENDYCLSKSGPHHKMPLRQWEKTHSNGTKQNWVDDWTILVCWLENWKMYFKTGQWTKVDKRRISLRQAQKKTQIETQKPNYWADTLKMDPYRKPW